jgi:hypothetical protein
MTDNERMQNPSNNVLSSTVKSLLFVGHEFLWFSWVGQSTKLRSDEILSGQILLAMSLFCTLQSFRRFSANFCVMNAQGQGLNLLSDV